MALQETQKFTYQILGTPRTSHVRLFVLKQNEMRRLVSLLREEFRFQIHYVPIEVECECFT